MKQEESSAVVLLVDDEMDFLASAARVLERRGFSVLTACSGDDALDILRRNTIDLVVLDVKMPGMDGEEVFLHIQRDYPGLPVIMLTGHGTISHAFKMSKSGVVDYVAKPCDMDLLAAKIRSLIEDRLNTACSPEGRDASAPSVLLVDDEADFLQSLSRPLVRRGLEVHAANGGDRALMLLRVAEIDVVVLDLKMPGIDGLEVLRRIRCDFPDVRVIVLSGRSSAESSAEALKLGAMDFLPKPPDVDALAATIFREAEERSKDIESRRRELVRKTLERHPD